MSLEVHWTGTVPYLQGDSGSGRVNNKNFAFHRELVGQDAELLKH
jgi:hypothetical protein